MRGARVVHVVTCLSVPSCGVLYRGDVGEVADLAARRHSGELRGGPTPAHSVITEATPVGGPGPESPRRGPDRAPPVSSSPRPT